MFTVCPKCTLTLVVTTVDLRAGQGYVRCGRCANVFNALIALREGEPGGTGSDTAKRRLLETEPEASIKPAVGSGVAIEPEPEPEPEPESEPAPEPEPEPELTFETDQPVVSEEQSLEFDAAATDVSEIFISPQDAEHDTNSGTYEEVVLAEEPQPEPDLEQEPVPEYAGTDTIAADEWSLLDDTPADDESVIEESPLAAEAAAAPEPHAPDPPWVEEMFAEAEAEAERSRTAEHETFDAGEDIHTNIEEDPPAVSAARASTGAAAPSDTVLEPLLASPVKGRPNWQYIGGVALLVLALVLQVLHYNRQSLALNSTFGGAATKVYGWFGVTLMPRWDLTAYSVKQLGAEAEGSGSQLRVRLSVQNDSSRVQPLPLLRLTLQDRYGNAVATRDLTPADYLPKRVADQRLLEPDQRIDVELHVVDSNKAAIGFEIDACLKGEGGAIGCANEARRRAAAG